MYIPAAEAKVLRRGVKEVVKALRKKTIKGYVSTSACTQMDGMHSAAAGPSVGSIAMRYAFYASYATWLAVWLSGCCSVAGSTQHLPLPTLLLPLPTHSESMVILAADVSPVDVITHIPVFAEENGVPYVFVPSKVCVASKSLL